MSLSTATLRERWTETQGNDPIFAAIDGSNRPNLPQTAERSHSLLLDRGLIRIALSWPARSVAGTTVRPEFQIEVVRDPSGCNTSSVYGLVSQHPTISVFRRPRMVGNLKLIASNAAASLMADGREPTLRAQAITAGITHEEASAPLSEQDVAQILAFEEQLFVAQSSSSRGGLLIERSGPAILGPQNLAEARAPLLNGRRESIADYFSLWRKPPSSSKLPKTSSAHPLLAGANSSFLAVFQFVMFLLWRCPHVPTS